MFSQDRTSVSLSHNAHPTHIEAARSMALLTKYFYVESFTPGW